MKRFWKTMLWVLIITAVFALELLLIHYGVIGNNETN